MRNKFFIGTYGWDKLSKYLFILGAILVISRYTAVFGAAIMLYAFIRTLSRNFQSREKEKMAFENWLRNMSYSMERLKYRYKSWRYKLQDRKYYVIIKCPNCSQKLRLPRHKGKILITCKKCSTEFKAKT
jgi:hypothetical protein